MNASTDLHELTERITDWRADELDVDASRRVVRHLALTGTASRNGYAYAPEALREAVPLYENKPVFLDHAASTRRPFERSTRDLAGSIVNVRFDGTRIRGDVVLLDTEAGRIFLALAEARHLPVGMSHVVLARKNADRSRVEKIEEVVSVDAVVYPATTTTLREQSECFGEEAHTTLLAERDELRRTLEETREELAACQRRESLSSDVARLLAASGLPEFARTELFREQLLSATSPEERRALIEERRALLQRREGTPSSLSRVALDRSPCSDNAIVEAIRRSPWLGSERVKR